MTPETMRAAVLVDVGRIEVRDVPVFRPAPHEVLVRVTAVGLCGTDLHIVSGEANYNRDDTGRPRALSEHPQILGHEIVGVVEEFGIGVRDVARGTNVVIDQGRSCVSEARVLCEYCLTGDSHQCENYREHGITGLPGGFAEYVTVPAVNTVAFDGALSAEHAALVEPLGCVLHSTETTMRTKARYALDRGRAKTVLVCGGGPAGLLFVQYLRNVVKYDGVLLLSEPNVRKRLLAERFGAVTIDPHEEDLVGRVTEITNGRHIEVLIEASGSGEIFKAIPGLIRKQATVLLYGHGHAGVDMSVMNQIQFLEPTLLSPVGASGGHDLDGRPVTYRRALRLIESGTIDVAPLITNRYSSLDDVPRAFSGDHRLAGYVKGVVTP